MASRSIKAIAANLSQPAPLKLMPTPEREAKNDFRSAGMASKLTPVIETLALQWSRDALKGIPASERRGITPDEFAALDYYREQAHKAQDDEAQTSVLAPERIMGGNSRGAPSGIPAKLRTTPAIIEVARIEQQLGGLLAITRAIAVEDQTLTSYCIAKHGGKERTRDGKTLIVPVGPNDGTRHIQDARDDLRRAARRIAK